MAAVLDRTSSYYVGIYPPTGDYELLDNQPAVDGVVLTKDTTKADLDLDKVFQYRGQVDTYDDLPTSGMNIGDTYNVADTGENYAWNGTGWDLLTGTEAVYWRNGALESMGSILTIDSDKNPITNLILEDITDVTATKNEVNQLHQGTAVKNDFIKLHNITSTANEINQLHSSGVVKADLTKLHNVSADANELNILDGATLTTTELNYVDGVTSSIQNQLNTLTTNLNDEVSRATDAELDLNDKIEAEATARETADTTLDGKIDAVSSNLTTEISDRTDADSVLDGRLDVLEAKDYVLYTDISTQDNPNRKAIILNNHDGIFGKDTSGNTRLLAMLSKYNVADYGTTATHTNLNTQRIVTVNDNQAVLTDKILNQIILEGNKIDITEATVTDPTTGFQFKTYTIGADLADYYTKSEVDGKLTAAMHFKGTVSTADDLPDENQQVGDMYNVLDTGSNYAWDGTDWDKLSETIDLSPFTNHINNTSNPHSVTKAQVGLGNVDNTADLDKPISTATQSALDDKQDVIDDLDDIRSGAELSSSVLPEETPDFMTYYNEEVNPRFVPSKIYNDDNEYVNEWTIDGQSMNVAFKDGIDRRYPVETYILNETNSIFGSHIPFKIYDGLDEYMDDQDYSLTFKLNSTDIGDNGVTLFTFKEKLAKFYIKDNKLGIQIGDGTDWTEVSESEEIEFDPDTKYYGQLLFNVRKDNENKIIQFTLTLYTDKFSGEEVGSVSSEEIGFRPFEIYFGSENIEDDWADIFDMREMNLYKNYTDLIWQGVGASGLQKCASTSLNNLDPAGQAVLDSKANVSDLQAQVTALTKKINDLKLLIPQEVFDASTTRTAMNSSGKVTLCEDIDLGKLNIGAGIFASNDTSVNLNGHTIQSAPTGGRAMLLARGTAKYTFNGDGEFIDTADDSSAIWCSSETASITINNGTFISEGHTETIYCEKGTITINGGEFKTGAVDKTYLLNCKDANYQAGTAKIIVKGGKFWDFDPHNNTAEGPNTNFCAEGYTTVSEEIDGHTVYTVVKE